MTEHKAPKTLEDALESFWEDAKAIMLAKRRLRGHENITAQGLYGVITRVVEDKMARIKRTVGDMDLRIRMHERGIPQATIDEYVPLPTGAADEELEDDFVDAANYFIIAWLLWQDWWELPLASELPREPIEGDCPECYTHFTSDTHSYDEERPYDGRCPSCVRGHGPGLWGGGWKVGDMRVAREDLQTWRVWCDFCLRPFNRGVTPGTASVECPKCGKACKL